MAERVGFEPTVPLPVHLISSQGRYNHFDTAPYAIIKRLRYYNRIRSENQVHNREKCVPFDFTQGIGG